MMFKKEKKMNKTEGFSLIQGLGQTYSASITVELQLTKFIYFTNCLLF